MLSFINAILGSALLVAGRKLFWLFVGAAGFVTGFQFTVRLFQGPEAVALIVGLVVGLIFAVFAIFLQTIAIGIAGFLAGGYILQTLTAMLGVDAASLIIYIVGGTLGVILVSFLFDWAIITLSSLAGAALIVEAFQLQRVANGLVFLILVLAGVLIQGTALRNQERPAHTEN